MARVLIDGPPTSGKSTLAVRTVEILRERGEQLFGFTTSEIRRGGRRTGFTVTGVASGLERVLALRGVDGPKVGTYGVDVEAFEEVALIEITSGLDLGGTLVIDEVGKMELLSPAFAGLVEHIFTAPRLLATAQRPVDKRVAPIVARSKLRRVGLPRHDRAELPLVIAGWIVEEDLASAL